MFKETAFENMQGYFLFSKMLSQHACVLNRESGAPEAGAPQDFASIEKKHNQTTSSSDLTIFLETHSPSQSAPSILV